MKTISLEIPFKGSRDYLHGTDMFNTVMETLTALFPMQRVHGSNFYLNIHAIARHQCDLHLAEDSRDLQTRPSGKVVAQFGIQSPEAVIQGWLIETERQVECRVPYQEEDIEAASRLAGQAIEHVGVSRYTPVEVLVAMTKVLHLALHPAAEGRWMFTKLELGALPLPTIADGLRIELLHNLNNRITKSAITKDSELLGYIYFSLVTS